MYICDAGEVSRLRGPGASVSPKGTRRATSVNVQLPCLCWRTRVRARCRETLRVSPPSSAGAEVARSPVSHVWCRLVFAAPQNSWGFRMPRRRSPNTGLCQMRSNSNARNVIPSQSFSFKRKCLTTSARESLWETLRSSERFHFALTRIRASIKHP